MLERIVLQGFKSFRDRTDVTFGDLTILTGANNAGKSTVMQPLLLMKQTLEAMYDPGPLLLQGPYVAPSSAKALFWSARAARAEQIRFAVSLIAAGALPQQAGYEVALALNDGDGPPVALVEGRWHMGETSQIVRPGKANGSVQIERLFAYSADDASLQLQRKVRGLLEGMLAARFVHVPAARSLAAPYHPLAAIQDDGFRGRFVEYVPSIIAAWQAHQKGTLAALGEQLRLLELAGRVEARRSAAPAASSVALGIGRLLDPADAADDWVNLAEAGSGIAHALPVVVALLLARAGWLVYVEEPEAHLHPRAIRALPVLIRDAIRRGAQVVIETHSELLLRSIQAQVAGRSFDGYTVRLHWLSRDEEGVSHVTSADLDERGAFSDLPIDLDDISLRALEDYLDAAGEGEDELHEREN